MKEFTTKKFGLPGKALLILFSLLGFVFAPQVGAQTNPCVKGDFDFKVDHSSKTVKFEAKASQNAVGFAWDFGDGGSGYGKDIKHKFDSAGSYKVCLTIYGYDSVKNSKCYITVCKRVTINGCSLKAEFQLARSGLSVKAAAKSNSRNTVFGWSFGDGSDDRGQTTSHTYSKPGKYVICLIAKDTVTNCTVRVCEDIKLGKDTCDLKVDFAYKTDGLGVKVEGKADSKNAVYGWSFGDGTTTRGRESKHEYSKPGKYTICLIVKDTVTGCTARECKDIKVEKDSCNIKLDFAYRVDGNTIKLEGKADSRHAVYGWTFGDGSDARGREAKHEYQKPGKYTVCLIVKDTVTGCKARICKDIVVGKKCDLKADFEFVQDGNDFKFRAKASDTGARFKWSFGDGNYASGATTTHSYKKPGVYEVCVVAYVGNTSGNDACAAKVCKRVEVKRDSSGCNLKADFKYVIDGNKVKVRSEANEKGVHFYWSWGDGGSSHGVAARHKYKKYGVYEVCLIAFNPRTKCKVLVCKKIVIEKPCRLKADFKYRVDSNLVVFKARSNSSTAVYGWVYGDGTSQRGNPARHRYTKPGVYKVTLIVKDTVTGCEVKITKRIFVNPKARKRQKMAPPPGHNGTAGGTTVKRSTKSEVRMPDNDWTVQATPIPSTDNVDFSGDKVLSSVKVFNTSGNEVLTEEFDFTQSIDITTLPTGYYFAHLVAEDGSVKIVKFIKN